MTTFADIGLDIVFGVPVTMRLSTTNFLLNGGFETAGFSGWTQDTDGGNVVITQTSVTAEVHSGTWACKLTSAQSKEIDHTVFGNISQSVTLKENTTYQLSFWSKANDRFVDRCARFAIKEGATNLISTERSYCFSSSDWHKVTRYFTTISGSVTLYLYQSINSSGITYIDDVVITEMFPTIAVPSFDIGGSRMINSYRHAISAVGGFDTMAVTTTGDEAFLGQIIETMLGREVIVNSSSSGIVWEGFVDSVAVTIGGLTTRIGPLTETVNRGRVIYKNMDWDTIPPVSDPTTAKTVWVENLDSVGRFGILEGILSGGEGRPEDLLQLLNTALVDTSWPEVMQNFSLGSGKSISVTIQCKGYHALLNKYYYTQTGQAGLYNVSTKFTDILRASPQNLFNANEATIITNTTQVEKYADGDKHASALFKELIELGDEDFNRYVYGLYEKRHFVYKKVTDVVSYIQNMSTGDIETASGGNVRPWNVRPAKWMFVSDAITAKPMQQENLRSDPRYIYIEKVNYVAPYGLTVSGGKANTFKSRLEKLGLGGL